MTYSITKRASYESTPIIGGLALAEALEYCRQRYGVQQFHCQDADVLEVECHACEDVDEEGFVHCRDGCRAVHSEPLYLNGRRDDCYLLLERIR